jgi:heterotetrameric sarcosine oxidase delta subunit
MLMIQCPHCGGRDEVEFRYAGHIGPARPTGTNFQAWTRYLYRRDQKSGEQLERWLHVSGCRHWLEVRRDMRSNRILEVRDCAFATAREP